MLRGRRGRGSCQPSRWALIDASVCKWMLTLSASIGLNFTHHHSNGDVLFSAADGGQFALKFRA